ncbi:MAG: hypothetical protein ACM3ZU_07375 [Bacteroidota bacterium]
MRISFDGILLLKMLAALSVSIIIHEHAHAIAALVLGQGSTIVGLGRVGKPVLARWQIGPIQYFVHLDWISPFFGYYQNKISGWRCRVSAATPLLLAMFLGAVWRTDIAEFFRHWAAGRSGELRGTSFWVLIVAELLMVAVFGLIPTRYFKGMTSDGTRIFGRSR